MPKTKGKCFVLVVIMSSQSNSGSSVPPALSVNTPDGSPSPSCHGQTYQWDEKQQKVINDYREYYLAMTIFVEDLEQEGPEGKVMPKKPKGNLRHLLGHKQISKLLIGKDLHEYLIQKIVTYHNVTCPKVSDEGPFTSLENTLEHLKSGYKLLKKQNSIIIGDYIDYGDWLNIAFELHYTEKLAGKLLATWKEWLEANVGIQDSYARKLREVAKLLGKYPRFRTLGLPFSEIYQRRKQIQAMLSTNSTLAHYWQAPA